MGCGSSSKKKKSQRPQAESPSGDDGLLPGTPTVPVPMTPIKSSNDNSSNNRGVMATPTPKKRDTLPGSSKGYATPVQMGQDPVEFLVGEVVQVRGKVGKVKFIGRVHFAPSIWIGIELDLPLGPSNGTVGSHSYFDAEPHHGIFVPAITVSRYLVPDRDLEQFEEYEKQVVIVQSCVRRFLARFHVAAVKRGKALERRFTDVSGLVLDRASLQLMDIPSLTDYFRNGTNTALDLVSAIYWWIIHHVKYAELSVFVDHKIDNTAGGVLQRMTANCYGYANLFRELCVGAGLEDAEVVYGWTHGPAFRYDDKFQSQYNHAWNYVEIDGLPYLVDCTFGAGYLCDDLSWQSYVNAHYLLTPPEVFAQDHYPTDPAFSLLPKTKPLEWFESLPFVTRTAMLSGTRLNSHKKGLIETASLAASIVVSSRVFCQFSSVLLRADSRARMGAGWTSDHIDTSGRFEQQDTSFAEDTGRSDTHHLGVHVSDESGHGGSVRTEVELPSAGYYSLVIYGMSDEQHITSDHHHTTPGYLLGSEHYRVPLVEYLIHCTSEEAQIEPVPVLPAFHQLGLALGSRTKARLSHALSPADDYLDLTFVVPYRVDTIVDIVDLQTHETLPRSWTLFNERNGGSVEVKSDGAAGSSQATAYRQTSRPITWSINFPDAGRYRVILYGCETRVKKGGPIAPGVFTPLLHYTVDVSDDRDVANTSGVGGSDGNGGHGDLVATPRSVTSVASAGSYTTPEPVRVFKASSQLGIKPVSHKQKQILVADTSLLSMVFEAPASARLAVDVIPVGGAEPLPRQWVRIVRGPATLTCNISFPRSGKYHIQVFGRVGWDDPDKYHAIASYEAVAEFQGTPPSPAYTYAAFQDMELVLVTHNHSAIAMSGSSIDIGISAPTGTKFLADLTDKSKGDQLLPRSWIEIHDENPEMSVVRVSVPRAGDYGLVVFAKSTRPADGDAGDSSPVTGGPATPGKGSGSYASVVEYILTATFEGEAAEPVRTLPALAQHGLSIVQPKTYRECVRGPDIDFVLSHTMVDTRTVPDARDVTVHAVVSAIGETEALLQEAGEEAQPSVETSSTLASGAGTSSEFRCRVIPKRPGEYRIALYANGTSRGGSASGSDGDGQELVCIAMYRVLFESLLSS